MKLTPQTTHIATKLVHKKLKGVTWAQLPDILRAKILQALPNLNPRSRGNPLRKDLTLHWFLNSKGRLEDVEVVIDNRAEATRLPLYPGIIRVGLERRDLRKEVWSRLEKDFLSRFGGKDEIPS
jgi:hypothetical protein